MKPRTIALASLGLTAIGTAFAGFQLWPRNEAEYTQGVTPPVIEAPASAPSNSVSDCSAGGITDSQVSIDCSRDVNISTSAGSKAFEVISTSVDASTIDDFARRLDAAADRIVRLQVYIDPTEGPGYAVYVDREPNPNRLNVTRSELCGDEYAGCGGVEYVFDTREGGRIYWTNGGWAADGYFSVQPVQGMHQGYVSVAVVGIPDSQARLADPAAR